MAKYKALETLLTQRTQIIRDFASGKIKSIEARKNLKIFDALIAEEKTLHQKRVNNYHARMGKKWKRRDA